MLKRHANIIALQLHNDGKSYDEIKELTGVSENKLERFRTYEDRYAKKRLERSNSESGHKRERENDICS